MDVDILDIGRAIVDAPLLDMRMEVIAVEAGTRQLEKGVDDDI